ARSRAAHRFPESPRRAACGAPSAPHRPGLPAAVSATAGAAREPGICSGVPKRMTIDCRRIRGVALAALAAALVLAAGCRTEQTRPGAPSLTAARVKAIQQAERERAAAEAREHAAGGAAAERPGTPDAAGG